MKTVLFLDFDGVLHHIDRCRGVFCHVPKLEAVVRDYPALDIVISSAWRYYVSIEQMRQWFSRDIRCRIIDVTPCFDDLAPMPYMREEEIRGWLYCHGRHPLKWMALDDSPWLFHANCPNLILVNPNTGFNDRTEVELRKRLGDSC